MKNTIASVLLVFLISIVLPAYAQQKTGYSTGAYSELGTDDTYLERVSDWFATAGKSREEKILILSQRRANRKMADTQKKITRKKKEIEKKKKKAIKDLEERKRKDNP